MDEKVTSTRKVSRDSNIIIKKEFVTANNGSCKIFVNFVHP